MEGAGDVGGARPAAPTEAAAVEEQAALPAVEEAEVTFLLVQTLLSGPFRSLGEQLAEAAAAAGLLPARYDVLGNRHPLSLSELQQRYAHIPAGGLRLALSRLLQHKQQEGAQHAQRGLTSLLEAGTLGLLLAPGQPGQPPGTVPAGAASLGVPGPRPPPHWVPPFHAGAALPQRALLRECGAACAVRAPPGMLRPAELAGALRYHKTFRGHRSAVYCVIFDKSGRYVATGSDDRLVKIWSVQTGLLRSTCRGHDAEITDLSVSCDNGLLASASMDTTIRVWSLQGDTRMGAHVSVLVGHSAPVTFLDFSPTLSHALLSSSFDGTCRIWNARDPAAPPLVLRADPLRFALEGQPTSRPLAQLLHDPLASPSAGAGGGHAMRSSERPRTAAAAQQAQQGGRQQAAEEEGGTAGEAQEQVAAVGVARSEEQHPLEQDEVQLLVCCFSRDGTYITAGSNDCHIYVWHWPLAGAGEVAQRGPAASVSPLGQPPPPPQQQQQQVADGNLSSGGKGTPGVALGAAEAGPSGAAISASMGAVAPAGAGPSPSMALAPDGAGELGTEGWPAVQEVARLAGHRNDVILMYWSNAGDRLATGSKDGTVRVWRPQPRGRRRLPGWVQELTIPCPPDEEAARRARQRRRAPAAPSIDQISWSCDDQRLVVSVTDHTVRVFHAATGQLLHCVREHTEAIHVLECHPTYPRLAVSASYDGQISVWDIAAGAVLHRLSSKDTRPDGRDWPVALPLTDGHFAPDGMSLAVTDTAGQLHYYSIGADNSLLRRGPYDQFLSNDYSLLIQDAAFNVIDAESQLPAHVLTGRELLCDALGNAYPPPFQEAFRAARLLAASPQDASVAEEGKQPGYLLASPLLTAAAWHATEAGASENGVLLAVARAQEQLLQHEEAWDDRERPAAVRQQVRQRRREEAAAAAAAGGEARGWEEDLQSTSSGELYHQPSDVDLLDVSSSGRDDDEEDFLEGEEEGGGLASGQGGRRRRSRRSGRQRRSGQRRRQRGGRADEEEEGVRHSARLAGRRGGAEGAAADGRHLRSTGQREQQHGQQARQEQQEGHVPADAEHQREQQRLDREQRLARRQQLQDRDLQQRRHRRQRQAAAARQQQRGQGPAGRARQGAGSGGGGGGSSRGGSGSEGEPEDNWEDWDALAEEEEEGEDSSDEDYLSDIMDEEEEGTHHGPSHGPGARGGGKKRQVLARRDRRRADRPQRKRQRTERRAPAGPVGSGRDVDTYSWLAGHVHTPGIFIPQAGDEVVYLREGHEQYLRNTNDKRQPPWQVVARGGAMRPAEPCRVAAVDYVISDDGHDYTLARLTLLANDPASPLQGRSFVVDVPPPSAGHAEFVVLRARYDTAVRRCWEVGDQCQMWWTGEGGTGEWWVGAVVADALASGGGGGSSSSAGGGSGSGRGSSAAVLDDPYGCGGLWERYTVEWQGVVDAHGVVVPRAAAEDSQHSPWELYELGTTTEEARSEAPALDPALRSRLLAAAERASASERFGDLFAAAPECHEAYESVNERFEFYNRLVALPLSLSEIIERLRAGYYHQREAVARDIQLLVQNAATYNGEESDITNDAQALVDYLSAALEGTPLPRLDLSPSPWPAAAGEAAAPAAAAAEASSPPSGSGRGTAPLQQQLAEPSSTQQQQQPEGEELAAALRVGSGAVSPGAGPSPALGAAVPAQAVGALAAGAAVPRRPRTLIIRHPRPPPGAEGGSPAGAAGAAFGAGSQRLEGLRVRISLPGFLRSPLAPQPLGGEAVLASAAAGEGPAAAALRSAPEQQATALQAAELLPSHLPLQQPQQQLAREAQQAQHARRPAAAPWQQDPRSQGHTAAAGPGPGPGSRAGYALRHPRPPADQLAAAPPASLAPGARYSLRQAGRHVVLADDLEDGESSGEEGAAAVRASRRSGRQRPQRGQQAQRQRPAWEAERGEDTGGSEAYQLSGSESSEGGSPAPAARRSVRARPQREARARRRPARDSSSGDDWGSGEEY